MINFELFLIESSNEEKLKHLEHAEDHPINAGAQGYEHAHNTLKGIHDALRGHSSKVSVSTKYDGSPSVVFGYHPENKRFFIASKSAFNKDPKINYTHADIEKNHGHAPGLVAKLKTGLTHLPKVTPHEGVYQGDFMYSKEDKDVKSSKDSFHFKPNTITYSAKKNSPEGEAIKKAKMGVVVHTAYHGPSMEHMKAEYNADTSHFNKHDDVHVISPKFDTKAAHYSPDSQAKFESHMKQAYGEHKKLGDYSHLNGHTDTIKTYINKTVKDETKPTTSGYLSHLAAGHNKKIADVKTPAAKEKYKSAAEKDYSHVENNRSLFDHTFKLHHHLQQAKNVLNDTLSATPQKFQHTIDGKLTKPEGHVAVINNRPTKLVDRAEFSRANLLSRPR